MLFFFFFFFFNDTATTEIYTLSLHDALPISELQQLAAVSCHDVAAGALCCARVRSSVVYVAACAAARRVGDVVRRAISDYPVRATASFSHPSAQRDAVRGLAEDAHVSRLSPIPRIRRPFWSHPVPLADCARRDAQPHGAVAGPRALTSSKRHSSWRATARTVTSLRWLRAQAGVVYRGRASGPRTTARLSAILPLSDCERVAVTHSLTGGPSEQLLMPIQLDSCP